MYDDLLDLFGPFMGNEKDRRAQIVRAFGTNNPIEGQLNFDLATDTFIALLIQVLETRFEAIEPGKSALEVLKESIEKQRKIEIPSAPSLPPLPPPSPDGVTRIFISYARLDGMTLARQLFDAFNARPGYSAWMDAKLHAEEVFSLEIQRAILRADYMVVVLSPDVNRDNPPSFVQRELHFATQEEVNKKVFAAKAARCFVPVIICGVSFVSFYDGASFETAFEKLIEAIEKSGRRGTADSSAPTSPLQIEAVGKPAPSPQEQEQAYLRGLAAEHIRWGKLYTGLKGEARIAPEVSPIIPDTDAMEEIDALFKEIDPAYAQHRVRGHSPDDDAEKLPLESFKDLGEAIQKFPRLALIGDPGSGKTTTLRRLTLDLAQVAVNDETGGAPLPLFAPLGAFGGGDLEIYLNTRFGDLPLRHYLPHRAVILLDGLNETAPTHVGAVQAWLDANPQARVIVTCRKLDYVERKLDLQRVDVLPLDVFRIWDFMGNWGLVGDAREKLFWGLAGEAMAELWRLWQDAGDTFERFWTAEKLESGMPAHRKTTSGQDDAYNTMRATMREKGKLPGLLDLMTNPYLLTLTIGIYVKRKAVPRNRGELFGQFVAGLLAGRGKLAIREDRPWIDEAKQRAAYAALATYLQAQSKQTFATGEEIQPVFARACLGENPAHLLDFALSAGILERSKDSFRFSHQLLQEYFAAYGMGEDMRQDISPEKYFPDLPDKPWWTQTGWEETVIFLAGMEADPFRVVKWLTPVNPIVAWRCIEENGFELDHPAALALMEPRITPRTAPRARMVWGRRLHDHDPRPGVLDFNWGEDYWCLVSKGEYVYQGKPDKIDYDFWVAKFQITWAQWKLFLEAKDGYQNPVWWKDLHEDGRKQQQGGAGEQYFKFDNHPAERVSWYDGMAFCRWLDVAWKTGRIKLPITLPTEYVLRLPVETEWEKAASWDAKAKKARVYPWGDGYQVGYANINETYKGLEVGPHYLQTTTAVGIYPQGVSPCGALDMSGNVWEWCLNEYDSGKVNVGSNETRGLRGGGWSSNQGAARAAYRNLLNPSYRDDNIGFRVVVAPVSL